jgi:hypothetical protein
MIEDIIDSLGLRFLSVEKRNEILTMTLELISKRASIRIIESLNDVEVGEFSNIPKNEFEKIEDFLILKNPNAKTIFEEELAKTKNDILSSKINLSNNEQ